MTTTNPTMTYVAVDLSSKLSLTTVEPTSTSTSTNDNNVPWDRIDAETRSSLVWSIWALTWPGLASGYVDLRGWYFVVMLSAVHALLLWDYF
jgi:hypothetical protein